MGRILITGATGFVGRYLVPRLLADGHALTIARRSSSGNQRVDAISFVDVREIGPHTVWRAALEDCEVVVHLAAQVPNRFTEPEIFATVNDQGTARLVEQSFDAGVRRFIYLSTILAVAGNSSSECLNDHTIPRPTSPYGLSKLAGENHLAEFTRQGGIGISLRSPLIYGGDAAGNWRSLQRLAALPVPLPFASVDNRRSFIFIENLVDAIATVVRLKHLDTPGVYSVADEMPASLAQVITWLREGMDRPAGLFKASPIALRRLLQRIGMQHTAQSLFGNLEIDGSRFKQTYSWVPPVGIHEGIARSGADFFHRSRNDMSAMSVKKNG